MPRTIEWIHRLIDIQARLNVHPAPWLGRAEIETLFDVSPRQATRILHRAGAQRISGALIVSREEMRAFLGQTERGGDFDFQHRRRQRFQEKIEQARRQAPGRRVLIPVPEPGADAFAGDVQLEPGRLTIRFQTPVELMQKLLLLAQRASEDWREFAARVSGPA